MRTTHMTIKRFIEAEEIAKDGYSGHTLIHKGDFLITYRQEVTKDGEATYVIPKELFHALFKEIDPVKAWRNIAEFLNSPDEDTEKKWDPFKDTEIVKYDSAGSGAMGVTEPKVKLEVKSGN